MTRTFQSAAPATLGLHKNSFSEESLPEPSCLGRFAAPFVIASSNFKLLSPDQTGSSPGITDYSPLK